MQDPDIPPQEEGDTNGAVDGGRQNADRVARWAATGRSIRAFSPLPWITVTAPISMGVTETAAGHRDDPVSPLRIR